MKRIFHLSVVAVIMAVLLSAGTLFAGQIAQPGAAHGQNSLERDADLKCTWTEEVMTNKLVMRRGGQFEWVGIPTDHTVTGKCPEGVHENLK